MKTSIAYLCPILLLACSSPAPRDELAGETSADDTVDAKSDSPASSAYTYFEIRSDLRKCVSPVCGGFFLSRLNRSSTRCHDGAYQDACYTPALDWTATGLADTEQQKLFAAASLDATSDGVRAIVRGWFDSQTYDGYGDLGRFVVSEAWIAESDAVSDGVFVKIRDNGTRCITAPCPSLTERALDTIRYANISELDWSDAGLTDREISGFETDLATTEILVAGWRYYAEVNGHATKGRSVTAAYHRLANPVE